MKGTTMISGIQDQMMDAIAKNWKCDGIILHYNRGCEGLSVGIAEKRLGLLKKGNKVIMTYGVMT